MDTKKKELIGNFKNAGQHPDLVPAAQQRRRRDATEDELPYTGWEVESIKELVEGIDARAETHVLLGQDASREAVEGLAPAMRLLVLATHGAPGSSGTGLLDYHLLFEAGAEEEDRYRSISMRELFLSGRLFHDALIVTLSACHLGEVVLQGEEAMGFQQACLSAGAFLSLAPLWAVNDVATAILSVTYHRGLITEDLSAAVAMQRAMATVRAIPLFGHPVFWAAILPSGDAALTLAFA